ncbi:MAG TPA: hypothetical protein VK196_22285 [Magnetospirillum sp.]|nr:hypothetical protein [Magnetospirillum sp.]
MAARPHHKIEKRTHKPLLHTEETRARISAARLIDRLQNFALGDNPDAMSKGQITAAIALLNKVLPSLQSMEISKDETKTYVLRAPLPAKSAEEWLTHYGPKTIEHAKKEDEK